MNVQQNFHVPILCTGDDKTISDENQCQNKVQTISGNSKSVKVLEEFKRIYLERLRKIEEETPEEGAELKLKTLTSWINDLGEQNLMLVETVEQLEQEAADRVLLLEERLKKSSHIALEYLSKLEEYDNQFLNQTFEKDQPTMLPIKTSNRLMQAQQTEEILKTRISNLQNDISGLLELIRRARYEGSWDTNGLSFLEVTYEDIFGLYPHQNIKKITDNLESADHLKTTKSVSQQKIARALEDNILKDQRKAEHSAAQLQRLNEENQRLIKENKFLSTNLKNKSDKIALLAQHRTEVDEKKGVSFASPTKEDYRLLDEDLLTPLKEAQNGVELARKQDAQHIRELEADIQRLQNTLIHSQQDIDVFLQPVECEASQRGLQINNFEDKLQRLSSAMKDSQKNIEDYIRDKETSYNSQKRSEQKIKKLQLELESIQEDLEQCLKTFEASEV
ncbi:Early endosome antigen 1-like protein [Gryllus bimaculatus]|nr:Early endosome antigen 1-like protein [Gryllus bimaculatus]